MRVTSLGWVLAGLLAAASAHGFVWPNQIDRVERQLRDDDVATRRGAARQIRELPATVAAKLSLIALVDPDPDVRLEAVEVAVRQSPAGVAPILVPWLSDADQRLRLAAARALAVVPDERAVGALGRVLGDPDADVREAAALALGSAARPEAARLLLGHLDDPVPRVREVVVDSLARLGDPAGVVPLLGKVQDPTISVRRRVVRALGELGDDRAASSLLLALEDADAHVRGDALTALGRLRLTSTVPSIIAVFRSETDGDVRHQAIGALAALGSEAAVEVLVDALGDPGPGLDVGDVAAAVGAVGAGAAPRLELCLGGQPPAAMARGCAEALGAVGGAQAALVITSALRRGVLEADAALSALARVGDPAALPTVLEYLADPDPAARTAAAKAAAQLVDPRHPDGRVVAPTARALAAARTPEERRRLIRLLGRSGAAGAVPTLEPLVRANDARDLRLAAIEALGEIPPAGQDAALLGAIGDADGAIRWAAAVALRRCASGASARALLDQLEIAAARDRAALAVALSGAMSRSRDPALVRRLAALAARSRSGERDALLEALGRSPLAEAGPLVAAFGRRDAAVPDRAKAAETLGTHTAALPTLRRLCRDPDGAVRANALWSLGAVGTTEDVPRLVTALADPDVAAAGNAAGALARIARRTRAEVAAPLCAAVGDPRAYVRANALVAASLIGQRCDASVARRLLLGDESPLVRRAAALLLQRVSAADGRADRATLGQCAERDPDGAVAVACGERARTLPQQRDPVTVYVVPAAEVAPVARAPFALVLADGLLRMGVTDRRGVVFEANAPRGAVSLEVPAALAR